MLPAISTHDPRSNVGTVAVPGCGAVEAADSTTVRLENAFVPRNRSPIAPTFVLAEQSSVFPVFPPGRETDSSPSGLRIDLTVKTKLPSAADSRMPFPGSLVTRQYKGQTIVVKVLKDGVEYDGRRFSSLSAVAKEVTGVKWNGFRFFGLLQKREVGRKEK